MANSDDEDVLFSSSRSLSNQQGKGLLGNKVKTIDDVMNGPKEDRRLKKTLALCASFLALGLSVAVLGPTLLALQKKLAVDFPKMSYVFIGRSSGYLIGSILGGFLFDRLNTALLIGSTLLISGVGMLLAPFCGKLWNLCTVISAVGVAMGALDTGANVVCLRLWGKRSPPFLQALHFSFALGAFISPLIASPFIVGGNYSTTTTALDQSGVLSAVTAAPFGNMTTMVSLNATANMTEDVNSTAMPATPTTTLTPEDKGSIQPLSTALPTTKPSITTPSTSKPSTTSSVTTSIITEFNTTSELNVTESVTTSDVTSNMSTSTASEKKEKPVNKPAENAQTANEKKEKPDNKPAENARRKRNASQQNGPTDAIGTELSTLQNPASSQFQNVYIIIGIFTILVSVSFFYFYWTSPATPPQGPRCEEENESHDDFKNIIMFLMFLFYFLYVGAEIGFGGYIFTFARFSDLNFSVSTATLLNATFFGAFALGRGLSICLAGALSARMMLILDVTGCVLASLLLTLYGATIPIAVWVGTASLGLSMASLFPAGISWLESYCKVTGNMASILVIGSALGEMCFPMVIGWLFGKDPNHAEGIEQGPIGLMYITLAASCLTAILFVILQYLATQNGVNYKKTPVAPNGVHDMLQGVEEAFFMEELALKKSTKQTSKPIIPKAIQVKKHRE